MHNVVSGQWTKALKRGHSGKILHHAKQFWSLLLFQCCLVTFPRVDKEMQYCIAITIHTIVSTISYSLSETTMSHDFGQRFPRVDKEMLYCVAITIHTIVATLFQKLPCHMTRLEFWQAKDSILFNFCVAREFYGMPEVSHGIGLSKGRYRVIRRSDEHFSPS